MLNCDNKQHEWHHVCLATGGASAFSVVCKFVVVYSVYLEQCMADYKISDQPFRILTAGRKT